MGIRYPYESFAAIRRYVDFEFLRLSGWIAYVCDASGQFNIWRQRTEGGEEESPPQQLTDFRDDVVRRLYASKVDDMIVFFADRNGDERYQIYEMQVDGSPEMLTGSSKVSHQFGQECISPDGRLLAFSSNERDPRGLDLILYDREAGEQTNLTEGGDFLAGIWSKDSRLLLATEICRFDLYRTVLLDIESDERRYLTPDEGTGESVRYTPFGFSPDGSTVYLLSDRDRDTRGVMVYSVRDEAFSWLLTSEWNIEFSNALYFGAALSRDGERLAYALNEDGYSSLLIRDLRTSEEERFDVPRGKILDLKFSPDGGRLGMLLSTPKRPMEVYALELREMRLSRRVRAHAGDVPEEDLVEPELLRYESFDGLEIPAFLWLPKGVGDEKIPAIVSIHGGPMAQERPVYNVVYQCLVNHGYAIMAPNYRGSIGYGKDYERLIYKDYGGGDLKDYEGAALWLRDRDYVDKDRIGVFGSSFGGFATLSCVTRLPDYWKAAVDMFGPSDLLTHVRSYRAEMSRHVRELVGDPDEDEELLRERSPINYVDDVKADLLVIQGARDPRVVKAESDQIVEKLREAGKYVEYHVFEDEGHGATKKGNRVKMEKMTIDFFERRL